MSFSIAHGMMFGVEKEDHCSPKEFVAEFSPSVHHNEHKHEQEHEPDFCDTHCMFHISFLLPASFLLFEIDRDISAIYSDIPFYFSLHSNLTFRPPIA